jgi:hypothetical protein
LLAVTTAVAAGSAGPPAAATVAGFSPPSEDYALAYADEFSSLNLTDWAYRTEGNFGGYNDNGNVTADGNLHIAFDMAEVDAGHAGQEYTGGGLVSRHDFGYGYYEVRAKLYGATKGLHQSFWSMGKSNATDVTAGQDATIEQILEIDGFEADSLHAGYVSTAAHDHVPVKTDVAGRDHPLEDADGDGWFTMGYEWLPGKVKFYLDGKHVRTITFDTLYAPQKVWLTALPTPDGFGGAVPPNPGAEMLVDYFHYYARENTGNLLGNPAFQLDVTANPPDDAANPIGWIETGTKAASTVTDSGGLRFLRHQNGTVTTKQELENIPNGTYTLTAQVRSSAAMTGTSAMTVSGHGGSTLTTSIIQNTAWNGVSIANFAVTTHKATIAFTSTIGAAQWVDIDDVQLTDTLAWPTLDPLEIVVDNGATLPAYAESGGMWADSGLKGYDGSSTRFTSNGTSATWKPTVPATGNYDVYIYKVVSPVSDANAQIQVGYQGGATANQSLDYSTGTSGWVYLGNYPFDAGTSGYVRNTRMASNLRADAVKFVGRALVDDFEDANATGWRTSGGTWAMALDGSDDVYAQTNTSGDGYASTGDAQWRDYRVIANVEPTAGTGYTGVLGRFHDTNNFYTCRINRIGTGMPATPQLELYKRVGGTWTQLATAAYAGAPANGQWRTLTLGLDGDHLTCSVAGGPSINQTDSALLTGLAGARVNGEAARIDDLTVWRYVHAP